MWLTSLKTIELRSSDTWVQLGAPFNIDTWVKLKLIFNATKVCCEQYVTWMFNKQTPFLHWMIVNFQSIVTFLMSCDFAEGLWLFW